MVQTNAVIFFSLPSLGLVFNNMQIRFFFLFILGLNFAASAFLTSDSKLLTRTQVQRTVQGHMSSHVNS